MGIPRRPYPPPQDFAIEKLRHYVGNVKMFVCSAFCIPPGVGFFFARSTTVLRNLSGRTIPIDKGLIRDGRMANLRCPKADYLHPVTPRINDPDHRLCQLLAAYTGIRAEGPKSNIDSPYAGRRLHPDGSVMFLADFELGRGDGGIVFFIWCSRLSSLALLGFSAGRCSL